MNYYAYATGGAQAPASCPQTTTVTAQCSLAEALALVPAGGSVLLATPGGTATYYGNFSIQTGSTSPTAPVTIAPASGVANPVVDGDASGTVPCPTSSCAGPALTVAGGVNATLKSFTIQDSNNTATSGGGGIDDNGALRLNGITITGTQAKSGGAVKVETGANLTAVNSVFSGDKARSYGGAIDNGRAGAGTVTVSGSQFPNDTAAFLGGAIENGAAGGTGKMTITNSSFSNDTSEHGGAVDNGDGGTGTLNVSTSTFADDSATIHGGAINNGDTSSGNGTLTVTASTFTGDSSPHGGAIDNADASGTGTLTVRTSTFANDSTNSQGAAIESGDFHGIGTASVVSSTIDGSSGNAAIDAASGTFQIAGSIVAASSALNCIGKVTDQGYNLEDDNAASCGFTARAHDLVGVNPELGSLGNNGGPTQTMMPAASSPVISYEPNPATALVGAGESTKFLCPVTDQTGQGASTETYGCAIGSVDPANSVPVVKSVSPSMGPGAGGTAITIQGGNFAAGDSVSFGTSAATNVSVVSPTQITAVAPASASADGAGPVAVTVTDSTGITSPPRDSDIYTYQPADWSAYLGGAQHTSFNASARSISAGTLPNLKPIWQWPPPKSPDTGGQADFASPIAYGGVIYVGLADGEMYAISEATQQVLWSQFLGFITSTTCTGTEGVTATATVAKDPATGNPTVYVNAPDGHLYALDATTGNVVWKSVVGIPSTTQNDYYAWSSPTVANGKVYVGISSECDHPLVPSGVLSFSQSDGSQIASWDSQPAGVAGASVWSSVGVLPDGNVVATTGNSATNNQIPSAESVVVLDGSTLNLLDSWQVPKAQQIFDSDFGGSPTIFTAYPHGVPTTMIGACNKNGNYYAFSAADVHAGPIWQYQMAEPGASGPANCDAAAIWNGHELIEAANLTTINGTSHDGSVQAINATTGQPIWQTGLPGPVIGSPSEDGAGIVAAPVYSSTSGGRGVYLLSAATGAILKFISTEPGGEFAQPVFDGQDLFVGDIDSLPLAAYAITTPGQSTPISVSPSTIQPGTKVTITITGASNLTSPAKVIISGSAVRVASVSITSPTSATVTAVVSASAPPGAALDVTLVEPNLTAYSCTSCLSVG